MLRKLWIAVAVVSLAVSGVAHASTPAVEGNVVGLEIVQQVGSSPAVFVGIYTGKVNGKAAVGAWAAAVNHDPELPDEPDETINITGGKWSLQVVTFQGLRLQKVSLAGTLVGILEFLVTDQFSITAEMTVASGGSGLIQLGAILDHTVFPPSITGTLSQP
jgi:hypothetical protein